MSVSLSSGSCPILNATSSQGRFTQLQDGTIVDGAMANKVAKEGCDITNIVNNHIWPYKKFIVKEEELDFGSTLQKRLYYKLNLPDKKDTAFWKRHKERVRKALNTRRNNAMQAIRDKMKSKLCAHSLSC